MDRWLLIAIAFAIGCVLLILNKCCYGYCEANLHPKCIGKLYPYGFYPNLFILPKCVCIHQCEFKMVSQWNQTLF